MNNTDEALQHNLLTFGFIMLWVRGRFVIGEILLIINLFNLIALYFRHSTYPRLIHIPIVSAPLAWTYVAILWDGAAAVNARNLPARILANIAIWGILGVGGFYVLAFKDYTMGFELAILTLGKSFLSCRVSILTPPSFGTRTNWHKDLCSPMDLCFHHHGSSRRRISRSRYSRSARSEHQDQTRGNRQRRP